MTSLPYVTSPGNIDKALNGIKNAAVPERVSQDFVKTILKIPGGSGTQMTTYLKKLGLAQSDGAPTDLYRKFRNPTSSPVAIASCIKTAYAPLYVRNEFMHELDDKKLLGLIVEETGLAHDSPSVKMTLSCIKHLKVFANFEEMEDSTELLSAPPPKKLDLGPRESVADQMQSQRKNTVAGNLGLNLGYTINLNLPATSDPNVFDAIFRSLKEHLLSNQDG